MESMHIVQHYRHHEHTLLYPHICSESIRRLYLFGVCIISLVYICLVSMFYRLYNIFVWCLCFIHRRNNRST